MIIGSSISNVNEIIVSVSFLNEEGMASMAGMAGVLAKNSIEDKKIEKHEKRETDEQNSMQTLGLDSLIA